MITYFANPVCSSGPAMDAGALSMISTPAQSNPVQPGWNWCADSGIFGHGYPGDDGYLAWLGDHAQQAPSCTFATAPDVVGDAAGTLARSVPLLARIRALGFPAAFVAQNGAEDLPVPWDEFDVLFIGGVPECTPCGWVRPAADHTTKHCPYCGAKLAEWKLGPAAQSLITQAKAHGKWVHMGRVNSRKRLRIAAGMGCDSADGTWLTFGPDLYLPKLLSALAEINYTSRATLALAA
jgi:hypothetical protein